MVLADVAVLFLTEISTGSRRYFFEIRRICGRHRRGEQRDVLVGRGVGQDRLDVLGEAHVQHLVGLVEHQEPQLGQVEGAALQVVHDPAGRADHDVHAAAQGAELHAVPLAAVDREHVHARDVGGVPLEGLAHLERQLAGRRQHQRLRRLLPEVEPRQDRQRERRRLAGARLGEADDVATARAAAGWWRPGSATGVS